MSDNLSIGERIYCLLEDLKDLQPDIPDYLIQQAEELHEAYNQIKPSENIDILELRRFYEDLYKTHNLYDLAQEVDVEIYCANVDEKLNEKCYCFFIISITTKTIEYFKKFIGE